MKPAIIGHEAVTHDEPLVHNWRVSQLTRLGIPRSLAEAYADHLDWHQIAQLLQLGCPRASPSASPADQRAPGMWIAPAEEGKWEAVGRSAD